MIPFLDPGDYIDDDWVDAVATAINATAELGSNANGNWARFPSGLQLCWFLGSRSLAITSAYGSLFIGALSFTFPQAFAADPMVSAGPTRHSTGGSWASVQNPSTTGVSISYLDGFSRAAASTPVGYLAVGLWTP